MRLPLLTLLLLWLTAGNAVMGQQQPKAKTIPTPRLNVDGHPALPANPDSSRTSRLAVLSDTARTNDSLQISARRKGDIETTVKYAAKDSIQFDVQNRIAKLYSKSNIDYGDISLKAAQITVDYKTNVLSAEGAPDSTGKIRDKPVFKNGGETFATGPLRYNFKTKKGKLQDAVTQQGEGYVHAEVVKKNQLNEIYGLHGRYTTCNLEHPHFYINMSRMKVIPKKLVASGPFNLVIGDIPLPLGFLFGYFPTPGKNRSSGLIIPTFGQTSDRGFFLRNGGYYWAANEYIGVRLTGDIYSGNAESFGGFALTGEVQYIKRYTYNGRFNLSYSQRPANQILATNTENTNPAYRKPVNPKTFWLTWSHSPTPRPGGGRFSASVQAGSSDFNIQNNANLKTYLTPAFSSTVSYQKQLRNLPINYSVQASQSQNTSTGTMDFTLPDVTVGVARQYLYELVGLKANPLYDQLAVSYTLTAQNRLSNSLPARVLDGGAIPVIGGSREATRIPVKLNNLAPLLRNSQTGIQHQFQISIGSYTFLKHFNLQPSINYGETWYFKRLDYKYVPTANAIQIDTIRGFNRVYSYSGGLNLGTNIYGIVQVKGKKIEAIRHKITPSVSYQFAPNFLKNKNFYTQEFNLGNIRDANGNLYNQLDIASGRILNPRSFSYYNNFPYGAPSGTKVSQVSFSLQNQVEMKVRTKNDTTGTTPFEKRSLIDGLDFSTGYNFAADSLNLQPLSANFRTQIARKLNVLLNATFDFYQRDSTGRVINKYLFDQSKRRLARLANANFSLSYQFNSAQGGKKSSIPRAVAPTNDPALGNPNPVNPYEDYIDFELPWELSASFAASYTDPGPKVSRVGQLRPTPFSSASLNLSGSVKLTERLRLGYSSGYDFKNSQVTITSLDFYQDLHCWQISGNWRPFGYTQGYNITIAAKSSLLQDLKLNRNRSFLNR
ncbi:putative LPS assembly protein LptD [Hymenobacter sp. BT491]|uniref:putative LPS assembly protein LptD n=1 Tax=Hymenobacter sp. BT491 TaxID=2766779 RepID=UPI001653A997|nr:putative LPS assembly protein LptD [Hymenobacter sp. BT491]MBC6990612.1 LPS-assembly protein LptD [Hymenobacter sp. BT491]